jgi:hypothetical protein
MFYFSIFYKGSTAGNLHFPIGKSAGNARDLRPMIPILRLVIPVNRMLTIARLLVSFARLSATMQKRIRIRSVAPATIPAPIES